MEDGSELETEDLPPPSLLERELRNGLASGLEYYDEEGNRLTTVDAILVTLRRIGVVYGPGRTDDLPMTFPEDGEPDPDQTAVVATTKESPEEPR